MDRFSKNTQIPNFMKIRPVAAELFHPDGQTDMTKPTVAFRSFTNAPKNCQMSRDQLVITSLCLTLHNFVVPQPANIL